MEDGHEVALIAVGAVTLGLAGTFFLLTNPAQRARLAPQLALFGSGLMALFCLVRAAVSSGNTAMYSIIGAVQSLMDIGVQERRAPLSPPLIIGYGAAQGALSGLRTWIYYDQPLGQRERPRLVAAE